MGDISDRTATATSRQIEQGKSTTEVFHFQMLFSFEGICAVSTTPSTGKFTLEVVFGSLNSVISEKHRIFHFFPWVCR